MDNPCKSTFAFFYPQIGVDLRLDQIPWVLGLAQGNLEPLPLPSANVGWHPRLRCRRRCCWEHQIRHCRPGISPAAAVTNLSENQSEQSISRMEILMTNEM